MNTRHAALLLVGVIIASWSSTAMAAYCGLTGGCIQKCCPECEWKCQKVMKKCTYTKWEHITETREKTIYDTVYEDRTIHKVHRVSEIKFRDESFTYTRPVVHTQTREVPYTHTWPVYETQTREVAYVTHVPSYETRKRSIPYTTYHTVYDTYQRSVQYCVPRTVEYTQTITVPCGHWEVQVEEFPGRTICEYVQEPGCWVDSSSCGAAQKGCAQKGNCVYRPGKCKVIQKQCPPVRCCKRVWVPRTEERTINCTKVVYDWHTKTVPYTVARQVAETHTYDQEYTVVRLTPVRQTQLVEYQVPRMMSEQRMRTVSYDVTTQVQEVGTRRVPFAVHHDIPSTCVVKEPRQIPRQVTYTVTRCVPTTHVKEIPVYIYTPVPSCCPQSPCQKNCGANCQKCCDAGTAADAEAALAEIEAAKRGEVAESVAEVIPASATALPVSNKIEIADDVDPAAASRRFATGLEQYRDGKFAEATTSFAMASAAAPGDAKYAYFHALALYSAGKKAEAEAKLNTAVELEADAPIANWGRAMERVQGEARMWIETARQQRRAA